jgi:hypothetical protein
MLFVINRTLSKRAVCHDGLLPLAREVALAPGDTAWRRHRK